MNFPVTTNNGRARQSSFESLSVQPRPTSIVSYTSKGALLIVGAEHAESETLRALISAGLTCYYLVHSTVTDLHIFEDPSMTPELYRVDDYQISGYLGAFTVLVQRDGKDFDLGQIAQLKESSFDMVLEFSSVPNMTAEIPAPGYYWINSNQADPARLDQFLEEIPGMVGNFEKPKYYNYDPDICAHSRSGITACTRCIDVCPTDAIISIGEQIQVNPFLCQGGGSCSTACPTGAITYAYPPAGNLLETLRHLILIYRQAGGISPYILFFDQENGRPIVENLIGSLSENVLPVEVEEVGSLGIDILFGLLSYGATGATIVCENVAKLVVRELQAQVSIMSDMMKGLGFEDSPIELILSNATEVLSDSARVLPPALQIQPTKFMPSSIKRTDIRIALEHLHSESPLKPEFVSLPEYAPFGEIHVDRESCTLCMGCVSVCPATALEAGGDTPKLSFIENNCVQCGMCETACPEHSISLTQRYVFGADARLRSRTMNEDSAFHCRSCGKPFATRLILNRMKEKLKNHWMFVDRPDAMARLEMCEDCRVKEMFVAERDRFHS